MSENEGAEHGKYPCLEDKVDPSPSSMQRRVIFILSLNSVLTTEFLQLSDLGMTLEIKLSNPIILEMKKKKKMTAREGKQQGRSAPG